MADLKKFRHVNLSVNFSDFNLQAACGGGITEWLDDADYFA